MSIDQILASISYCWEYFPLRGYEAIFLFAFLEAFAFIGIIFPGTIIIVLIGFLSYIGQFNFWLAFCAAVLGALVGDIASYYLGKRKGLDLKIGQKSIFKYLYVPEAGGFLLDKGTLSIIVGRFIGPTRAFVPFYMGAAGEKEKKFIISDIIGVLIWAAFYLLLGFFFGNSLHYLRGLISGLEFFIVLFLIFTIAPFVLTKILKKKLPPQGKVNKEQK